MKNTMFNTITKAEVMEMLESFIEKGVVTVSETKTKVKVVLHKSCTSWGFINVINELDRTCEKSTSYTTNDWKEITKYKITDCTIQIQF